MVLSIKPPGLRVQDLAFTLRIEQITAHEEQTIHEFMLTLSFKKCESDQCIYFKWDGQNIIFVAIYVDALNHASSSNDIIQITKQALVIDLR